MGFDVQQTVWLRDEDGTEVKVGNKKLKLKPTYVMVLDKDGNKFLVELDVQVYNGMRCSVNLLMDEAMIMVPDEEAVISNNSRAIGLDECAKQNNICALAYVCEGSMCYRRVAEDDPGPFFTVLRGIEVDSLAAATIDNGRPMPVVTFSALMANPNMTVMAVEKADREINANLLQQYLADWADLLAARDRFSEMLTTLNQTIVAGAGVLNEDLMMLMADRALYRAARDMFNNPALDSNLRERLAAAYAASDGDEKYKDAVVNYRDRVDRFDQVIASGGLVRELTRTQMSDTQKLMDLMAAVTNLAAPLTKVVE